VASSKRRLDEWVVEKGWAASLKEAQALILTGRVRLDGQPIATAGTLLPTPDQLSLQLKAPYVSRGGEKLASALKALQISVEGLRCLDIGASTGGFTDCLLQAGAADVIALDVGRNLLDPKLRTDARVHVRENMNFRQTQPGQLPYAPDFAVADVSFISLEELLKPLKNVLKPAGRALLMVKPQFETHPRNAPRGIVKDPAARQLAIEHIIDRASREGFRILGQVDSAVRGTRGNLETFLLLQNS
jgi:23S rRNA (cytidine1920-2'-O)/16S rRNA (cytidine1409-2'-O)-methyltransferase